MRVRDGEGDGFTQIAAGDRRADTVMFAVAESTAHGAPKSVVELTLRAREASPQ
jgi:hypothetical protein